ncbi:MAG: PKD domain-containing protein [Methanomicrobiales archaeon]|nr:PKD domain-containing protein [Methanomicrobiales archaeon]
MHLFVNGTLGSSWENKTAYINATGIRASFSGDPTIGKAPLTVQFTDESSEDNLSYFWEFGDGNTSEEIDPQHTYAEPGRYNVSLRINSSVNLPFWENRTEYIRVYSFEPEVEFDVDPSDGYAPLTVSFIDLSPIEGIITWEWDFGDGYRGIGETSAHTFSEAGKYSVMLNVSTENDTFSTMKRNIVTVLEDTEDTTHTVAPKPVKTTMVTIPAATPTPTIAPVSSSSIALYTLNFTGIELRTLDDGNQQVALSRSVLETEGIQVGEDADQLTLSYPTYTPHHQPDRSA